MAQEYSFVNVGVGNYQICFDEDFIIPLNYIQEDNVICTDKKNFIVLRHAFVDLQAFSKISRMHNNKIDHVNCIHINYIYDEDRYELVSSKLLGCSLKYIVWENECNEASSCKIVIEFEEMDAVTKAEACDRDGSLLKVDLVKGE